MALTDEIIDLRGQWTVRLDRDDLGIEETWYADSFGETIELPGTTDEARLGTRTTDRETGHLSRRYEYIGPVWYQRDVSIPESWDGSRAVLFLERTRHSTLWVNETEVGSDVSLTTPHRYDLSDYLTPGRHTLTLRVDNGADYMQLTGVQMSHMASEHTQTNWNGILGRIELRRIPPMYVDDVFIEPALQSDGAWIVDASVTVENETKASQECRLLLTTRGDDGEITDHLEDASTELTVPPNRRTTVEFTLEVSDGEPWDEYDPTLYELRTRLELADSSSTHVLTTPFGLRDFAIDGTQFAINGEKTFLRGKCDCCVFPETGYAPMTRGEWREVFETAMAYGINQYRYHSWCPPEAAFDAADELGIYLQPELPHWNPVDALDDDAMFEFYREEAERILDEYGNHPSFVLFTLGNELAGNRERMSELVDHCRSHDGRHHYAQGSNNHFTDPGLAEDDEFWITYRTDEPEDGNTGIRGSFPSHEYGHINNRPPTTDHDYGDAVEAYDVPLVSHEIGQYQAYPEYDEINEYTGVLEPRNLELFRDHLEAHGMDGLDDAFHQASGQLQVRCYREDIEAALRTEGFAGFQLLDLQDFPGQGTALVGVLDSHMNDKGFIAPKKWREFCSDIVPLVRLPDRTYEVGAELSATIQIAHYGPADLDDATIEWELGDDSGTVIDTGSETASIACGGLRTIDKITTPLDVDEAPERCTLTVEIAGSDARNEYDIWVFPKATPVEHDTTTVTRDVDEAVESLEHGEDVLFFPELDDLRLSIEGAFQSDFWNYSHFKDRGNPGTLGLLVSSDHPALTGFPTDSHSDWQWWRLVDNSRPVMLDVMPDGLEVVPDEHQQSMDSGYQPIIQHIDTPCENRKLGTLFEMSMAEGSLLVCTHDLPNMTDVPEARQLYESLIEYVESPAFDPTEEVHGNLLDKIVR